MTDHLVGVNGVVQIDPNEVLGIERDEGVVTGASVLLWPGRWRIALRAGGGGGGGPVTWDDVTGKPTSFPPASHRHDASEIDNLPTGSGGSTAWADITGKPAVIAAGADAAAARTAIGAGTSSLAIGTTGTTAAAGNRQATETATGMVELATTAEATAGTDTQRAVTPAGVKAVADTKAPDSHNHDTRYVRTVNGTGPDAAGDVAVSGGGGAPTLIATASPVNAAHTFAAIPGTYRALRLVIVKHAGTSGGNQIIVTFNGDTGPNYAGIGNTGSQTGIILQAGQAQTTQAILDVYGYAATHHKVLSGHAAGGVNAGNGNFGVVTVGGRWASSAAITSITVTPSNAEQGQMDLYLYGVN